MKTYWDRSLNKQLEFYKKYEKIVLTKTVKYSILF